MPEESTLSGTAAAFGVLVPVSVYPDDLDPFGVLYVSRYVRLTERAWNTYFEGQELAHVGDGDSPGNTLTVVKEFHFTHDQPVSHVGAYAVHLWVKSIEPTAVVYEFRFCSRDGVITYAHGSRTIVHTDPSTMLPREWAFDVRALAIDLQL